MAHFSSSFFKLAVTLLTLTSATLMAAEPVRRTAGNTRQLDGSPEAVLRVRPPVSPQASPQAPRQASPQAVRQAPRPATREALPQAALLDPFLASFIRPGITVKIVSAGIGPDGTITARVNIADPKGLPLDKDGLVTPGTVSMSFIAAYIPANKTQYVSYSTTTLKATLNSNPSQIQAANDSGGTITKNDIGDYTYTFKTKAPAGYDASATHAIGVSVNRNLTEFMTYDEWS